MIYRNIYFWHTSCVLTATAAKGQVSTRLHSKNDKGNNMNKNILVRAAFAAAILAAAAMPAQAVPITYHLQDVSFDDGTNATGSFAYDADTGRASDWNIRTFDGTLSAFTYNSGSVFSNLFYNNSLLFYPAGGGRYLNFTFDSALTNAGGTYALRGDRMSYECNNCGTARYIDGGSVSSAEVPEPATAFLMLPAALGFVAARRRAKRSAAAA
jgi:hypothetical protein